jgi:translation initiation factor IF-1
MDLYIFCVVLGAAGMAAMALLGFTSSHSGGAHAHDTGGHEFHGVAGHIHSTPTAHAGHIAAHGHAGAHAHAVTHGHGHPDTWKSTAWSWLSPRVLFNVLVGFGATGLIAEKLVGPVLALPIALVGGLAFEALVVRPIFNSLFRFESQPAQTLESAIMSQGKAVTGFDVNGNGLIALELGGEIVQILGTLTADERKAGIRVRAGDAVRIEDIDSQRNRCTVSRIGLSES